MKKILIVCGTGVATSTVVVTKVREYLASRGIAANIAQGKVMDLASGNVDADLVVATTEVPSSVTVPTVRAISLITGMGQDATLKEIEEKLQ